MGVTRISLGVQDFEPSVRQAIGREQSYAETQACANAARALGVGSFNLDLICSLPLQTTQNVVSAVRRVLGLKADWIRANHPRHGGRLDSARAGAIKHVDLESGRLAQR
jgi:oxygen-independent coproporphyrinogen III oxidase